jgi:hypothetical protein
LASILIGLLPAFAGFTAAAQSVNILIGRIATEEVEKQTFNAATQSWDLDYTIPPGASRFPRGLDAADLNGDGHLDAVVAMQTRFDKICWNDGAGDLSDCTDLSPEVASWDPVVADIDGQPGLDIFFAVDFGPNLVCLSDGTSPRPSFSCSEIEAIARRTWDADAGDLNGDGAVDVVFANRFEGGFLPIVRSRVCLNDGASPPSFTCSDFGPAGKPAHGVALADFDDDDNLDIVLNQGTTLDFPDPNPTQVCLNDGSANFTCGPTTGQNLRFTSGGFAVGDFNGDGRTDFIDPNNQKPADLCLNSTTNPPVFSCAPIDVGGAHGYAILGGFEAAPFDLDADGDLDVVFESGGGHTAEGFFYLADTCFNNLIDGDGSGNAFTCQRGTHRSGGGSGIIVASLDTPSDGEPPVVSNLLANPSPVEINTLSTLTATVDDSSTGGSTIASAQYSVDGGAALAMTAFDGVFDSESENVTAVLPGQATGVYEICVNGTDSAGNTGVDECVFLPVYDPNGGFVTGGGWVDSPSEADLENGASGKSSFGFVSKYKNGASTPDGNLQFVFKTGDISFHSTSMDWLVVTGQPRAMFRGEGQLNGDTTCKFEVDAWDESLSGEDGLGLKLFACGPDADINRYSLPATALGGGNIKIHQN